MDKTRALLQYQIALSMIPAIGDVTAKKLVSGCGGAGQVFRENRKSLLKIPGIGEALVNMILSNREKALERAEAELAFVERYRIRPLYYLDKAYPQRLKNCIDSPVMLYYRGNAALNMPKVLSVVGSRKATSYGKEVCRQIITQISAQNVQIVSGLAFGIDTCAHKYAMEEGLQTVAVLGHGLHMIYPPQNKTLAGKMTLNGGLLTEFSSGTGPDYTNFPRRNRIIAGMADAVLVVEAAVSGGALITAEIANSYNRDVFAVPGRVGDPLSEGCNLLIRNNKAALVQNAADVMYMMGWETQPQGSVNKQRKLYLDLSPEEEKVVELLREKGESGIDALIQSTGLTPGKAASALLSLEFQGIVKSLPGKQYSLA